MNFMSDVLPYAVIVCIVYCVCSIIKQTPNKTINHFIPAIAGASGAVLGIVAFYCVPDFPATDILSALAIGISSGFAATGVNQVVKQATVVEKELEDEESKSK